MAVGVGQVTALESGEAPFDAALAARICWYYFKEGQTQDAIAQRLGLTRKRVNRMLSDARDTGLVQITIAGPVAPCVALECRLVERFGLREAVVVPSPAEGTDVRSVVGAAAGWWISERLPPSGSLGINWGGTIHAAAQNLARRVGQGNTVVLLCGGLAESTAINPYDNAASFARALDATCYYVTAPMYTETQALRDALVESDPVRRVLAMVETLDLALMSAIDLTARSKALEYGVISRDLWRSLREAGAVGEICGHYLDPAGRPVDHPIADRTIRPHLDALRRVPQRVLAAGGRHKAPVIRAAIAAGLVHVLITDEAAAQNLLR
ncbi:sugar-binding transcriptional regulator [Rhodoplanes sp. TEM]|uniref:Sugar-binding transcriptional regulator n=1 Tax=Rhodoplanes tepidamans TaxID=200616 RepID=A0ABT5JBE2_RHOTP|nr:MULTISPECIES: sugar-binding transcriptional regulator [Rhodoplanes]MDC7786574.1 sugar-binding transcriptional regulator [Rhodoplanes tepidamans]MDC7983088.1 sugar-binding transcriptional regulator [Rhodoplanes sp. TEM]MDQ0357545.1 DNA-binding transcriptional regulator LsrR (DeoR family) [Rhodoplanes tepidamans]